MGSLPVIFATSMRESLASALGCGPDGPIPGGADAETTWERLARLATMKTVTFHLCEFGAPTVKPTTLAVGNAEATPFEKRSCTHGANFGV